MSYRVRFKPSAADSVRKLPKALQRRIVAKIENLAETPRPPGCKKLQGAEELYRVRSGEYRIVYMVEDRDLVVLVVKVGHRKDVYRRPR